MQGEAGAPGTHLRRLSLGRTTAAALLVACAPAEGERSGDPVSDAGVDVGVDDGSHGRGDLERPCDDDLYGVGTVERPAARLGFGRHVLRLCGGPDVFALSSAPGRRIRVALGGWPGLRFRLLTGAGEERLRFEVDGEDPAAAGGVFEVLTGEERLLVEGATEALSTGTYTLTLTEATGECEAAGPETGGGCLQGSLQRPVETLAVGQTQAACVDLPDRGQLLLTARCGDSAALSSAHVVPGRTVCRAVGPFPTERSDCRFELSAASSSAVPWLPGPGDGLVVQSAGGPQRWRGRLGYEPAPGLDPPAELTWRGELRARTPSGAVTGTVEVGAERVAFELTGFRRVGEPAELVIAATTRRAGIDVVVSPAGTGAEPWAVALASTPDDEPALEGPLTLTEADTPVLGALHAVEVLARHVEGTRAILDTLPASSAPVPVPRVHVRWSPGRAEPCGTCFSPGALPVIELSGRPGDPDIWDDAVLLHELGHWVVAGHGRDDSPGGAHDGDRTAPVVAWSEGLADFFAAWRLGEPVLVDRRADGPRVRDLETASLTDPLARGTSDGTLDGLLSERFVGAFLWDLLDDEAADGDDGDDGASVPVETLLAAALPLARAWTSDRGAPGFDLVDFVDVLICRDPVAGESAAALARARGLPHDGAPPAEVCTQLSSGG